MPSRKGLEQALTWLKSKMAEANTLDAINAEVCYNVILDLQEKRRVIGALYHQTNTAKKRAQEKLDEMELDRLYESAKKVIVDDGFTRVYIPEKELELMFSNERPGDK